jgi:hypothetical protein
MAGNSTMGDGSADSRWVAIPVALVENEGTTSLELEMQKAYAAFAAAEANLPGFVSSAGAIEPSSQQLSSAAPDSKPQVDTRDTSGLEPELHNTVNAVANASADVVTAAAERLEAVAGSYVESDPAPVQSEGVQAEGDALGETAAIQNENSTGKDSLNQDSMKQVSTDQNSSNQESLNQDVAKYEPAQSLQEEIPAALEPVSATTTEEPQPAAVPVPIETAPTPVAIEPTEGEAGNIAEIKETVEKESDLTATTAAAWANWRQIRSGNPRDNGSETPKAGSQKEVEPIPAEAAAMAVAAGAEKTAEQIATASGSNDISSIVDSVLAELRPKIMEEISRKFGEKK